MRRKKHRHHTRDHVLHVNVMSSPRLAWLAFLKVCSQVGKSTVVLAIIAAIAWGAWLGIRRALYQNPDFRLQVIDLNPNPAINEQDVAKLAGIDFHTSPSIFDVSVRQTEENLRARPDIVSASVERHLPGTLKVRVTPRVPKAWLRCPAESISGTRAPGNLLVDADGFAYPCPATVSDATNLLPVINLPASPGHSIRPGSHISLPELTNAFLLLDAAAETDSQANQWIESLSQPNPWSIQLLTRNGTIATFGLGDHPRQMQNLRTALDHAAEKGYQIHTINLIPKHNIPITLQDEPVPPRAIPVNIED